MITSIFPKQEGQTPASWIADGVFYIQFEYKGEIITFSSKEDAEIVVTKEGRKVRGDEFNCRLEFTYFVESKPLSEIIPTDGADTLPK